MILDDLLQPIGGRLAVVAMVLAVFGLGFLVVFLRWLVDFSRIRTISSLKPVRTLFAFTLSVAFLASAAAAAFLATSLRTYGAFTERTLVAYVECERINDNPDYEMLLRYAPVEDGDEGEPSHYLLKGDMWEIGGDILKWDPQLALIGIRPTHKVTRISSHGLQDSGEGSNYQVNGGTDELWLWLHEYGDRLPFVDAVYGSAVFTLPSAEQAFELYVGQDGYSLVKVPSH